MPLVRDCVPVPQPLEQVVHELQPPGVQFIREQLLRRRLRRHHESTEQRKKLAKRTNTKNVSSRILLNVVLESVTTILKLWYFYAGRKYALKVII